MVKHEEETETRGRQAYVKAEPQNISQRSTKPNLSVEDLTEEDWVQAGGARVVLEVESDSDEEGKEEEGMGRRREGRVAVCMPCNDDEEEDFAVFDSDSDREEEDEDEEESEEDDEVGFSENDKVNALWKDDGKMYPGKIIEVNKDGTYYVVFDDGDFDNVVGGGDIVLRGEEEEEEEEEDNHDEEKEEEVVKKKKRKKKPASDKEKKFVCTERGCSFRTKWKGSLKRHGTDVHNEGVVWNECPDCDYKAKQNSHLKRHRTRVHKGL